MLVIFQPTLRDCLRSQGTNPICLAVPGTADNPGVQLDMATSIGAMGKVAVAYRKHTRNPQQLVIT